MWDPCDDLEDEKAGALARLDWWLYEERASLDNEDEYEMLLAQEDLDRIRAWGAVPVDTM